MSDIEIINMYVFQTRQMCVKLNKVFLFSFRNSLRGGNVQNIPFLKYCEIAVSRLFLWKSNHLYYLIHCTLKQIVRKENAL